MKKIAVLFLSLFFWQSNPALCSERYPDDDPYFVLVQAGKGVDRHSVEISSDGSLAIVSPKTGVVSIEFFLDNNQGQLSINLDDFSGRSDSDDSEKQPIQYMQFMKQRVLGSVTSKSPDLVFFFNETVHSQKPEVRDGIVSYRANRQIYSECTLETKYSSCLWNFRPINDFQNQLPFYIQEVMLDRGEDRNLKTVIQQGRIDFRKSYFKIRTDARVMLFFNKKLTLCFQ